MKNNLTSTLSFKRRGRIFLGCCAVLFCAAAGYAQAGDTIVSESHRDKLFNANSFDAHLGWAPQKGMFVGAMLLYEQVLVRSDYGYNFFSATPLYPGQV